MTQEFVKLDGSDIILKWDPVRRAYFQKGSVIGIKVIESNGKMFGRLQEIPNANNKWLIPASLEEYLKDPGYENKLET